MIGQIQITSIYDFGLAKVNLMAQKAQILRQANMNCLSMCKRGGGVVDVKARQLASDMMVVELHVDV
jgi:hydroxymethylglutaryl-CoA synthase